MSGPACQRRNGFQTVMPAHIRTLGPVRSGQHGARHGDGDCWWVVEVGAAVCAAADGGPDPHPGKSQEGSGCGCWWAMSLRGVVPRIFELYLAGFGNKAIAPQSNRDGCRVRRRVRLSRIGIGNCAPGCARGLSGVLREDYVDGCASERLGFDELGAFQGRVGCGGCLWGAADGCGEGELRGERVAWEEFAFEDSVL